MDESAEGVGAAATVVPAMERVAVLSKRGSGVITRRKLLAAGFNRHQIDRWIERGYLRRLSPGVYAVGSAELSRRGQLVAALAAYGETAVLSHWSAAELLGMRGESSLIHVTVRTGSMRRQRGIALHRDRQLSPGETVRRKGLPVTGPARTICDLALLAGVDKALDLASRALREHRVTMTALREAEARLHRRDGNPAFRAVLAQLDGGAASTRSWLERRFLDLSRKRGLPGYRVNVTVAGYEVDCYWPRERVIVELDGHAHHSDPSARDRDLRRDSELRRAGYEVVRITYRTLVGDPDHAIGLVEDALRLQPGQGR